MPQLPPSTLAEFLTEELGSSLEIEGSMIAEDWVSGHDAALRWVLNLIKEFNDKTS